MVLPARSGPTSGKSPHMTLITILPIPRESIMELHSISISAHRSSSPVEVFAASERLAMSLDILSAFRISMTPTMLMTNCFHHGLHIPEIPILWILSPQWTAVRISIMAALLHISLQRRGLC